MTAEYSQVELLTIEAAHEIDLTNLDQALLKQASLFEEITRALPQLRQNTEITKTNRDQVKAALSLQFRDEAARSGKKTTEAGIESEILIDEAYQTAHAKYLQARLEQDQVERARDVMVQREGAIKGLITLYAQGYWSIQGTESLPEAKNAGEQRAFKRRA
jgi:hypothetical protein